tara:strand:- start:19 stop:432 length:414 start_codon:yes stop_codon:yes gene_type:complete
MARRDSFKMDTSQRRRRTFSDEFKIRKVRELEAGQCRIVDIQREYDVSCTAIYKWVAKFGTNRERPERLIVEHKSDTVQLLELRKRLAELERIIGQKQLLVDFKDRMIELAEEHYGVDIKKKFSTAPSSTTGRTGKN